MPWSITNGRDRPKWKWPTIDLPVDGPGQFYTYQCNPGFEFTDFDEIGMQYFDPKSSQ